MRAIKLLDLQDLIVVVRVVYGQEEFFIFNVQGYAVAAQKKGNILAPEKFDGIIVGNGQVLVRDAVKLRQGLSQFSSAQIKVFD